MFCLANFYFFYTCAVIKLFKHVSLLVSIGAHVIFWDFLLFAVDSFPHFWPNLFPCRSRLAEQSTESVARPGGRRSKPIIVITWSALVSVLTCLRSEREADGRRTLIHCASGAARRCAIISRIHQRDMTCPMSGHRPTVNTPLTVINRPFIINS